jgi:hypothetical protein
MMTTDWSASCGVPIVSAEPVLASEGGATTALPCHCYHANSSSTAFASFRSRASNPSVNNDDLQTDSDANGSQVLIATPSWPNVR